MVAINQARIQVELAFAKLQNTEALAAHLQGHLGLESHWEIGKVVDMTTRPQSHDASQCDAVLLSTYNLREHARYDTIRVVQLRVREI